MTDRVPDPADVLDALRKQVVAYERLSRLAAEQTSAIADGDQRRLLDVLRRREAAVAEAMGVDDVLAPVRADWEGVTRAWDAGDREAAAGMFGRVRERLAEVSRRDDRDAAGLRVRMATASSELSRVRADAETTRRIHRRYALDAYRRESGQHRVVG